MKRKQIQIMLNVILLVVMFVTTAMPVVMATEPHDIILKNVNTTELDQTGKNIVKILQSIGVVLSVVILIIIGVKYMLGSVEQKAEYKKTLMPYIIGAALIFAASIFAQVAYDFFQGWSE